MYHSVSVMDPGSLDPWGVTPRAFRRQMRLLKKLGYRSITASELVDAWNTKRYVGKVVVITFDDGLDDLVSNAAPILDEVGFRASAYVCPGLVGSSSSTLRPGIESTFATWAELRTLVERGWEIGHHSLGHTDMSEMSSDELISDIEGGRRMIRKHLGVDVQTVAYPWGNYSNTAATVLAESGAQAGLAVSLRAVARPDTPRYAIPRTSVNRQDGLFGFLLTALTGYRCNGLWSGALRRARRVLVPRSRLDRSTANTGQWVMPLVISAGGVVQHIATEGAWLL